MEETCNDSGDMGAHTYHRVRGYHPARGAYSDDGRVHILHRYGNNGADRNDDGVDGGDGDDTHMDLYNSFDQGTI